MYCKLNQYIVNQNPMRNLFSNPHIPKKALFLLYPLQFLLLNNMTHIDNYPLSATIEVI